MANTFGDSLLPEDIDYPTMVIKAGKQRIKRNLPFSKIKQ